MILYIISNYIAAIILMIHMFVDKDFNPQKRVLILITLPIWGIITIPGFTLLLIGLLFMGLIVCATHIFKQIRKDVITTMQDREWKNENKK